MKKQLVIFIMIVSAISVIPVANGQNNDNEKNNVITPTRIELGDEAAIVIGGVKITLADAIKTAIEKNHTILAGKYDVAMTDSYTKKYNTKYSPFFFAEGGLTAKKNPELMQNQYGSKETSLDASLGLSKSFSSGTTVTLGLQDMYTNTQDSLNIPENTYTPAAFFTIQQELLKNSFGYNDRRQQQMLNNASQMQKDAIIYGLSLVVVNVIVEYWNVIIADTHLENSKLMLQETKKVRRIVSDNVKLGLAEEFELNIWNSQVASSEAQIAQAQQQYNDALRSFLRTVDMKGDVAIEGTAVLSIKIPVINTEEAIKTAYSKRVDYLNAKRSLDSAMLELEMYENEALPSLTGSLSLTTMDYNDDLTESRTNAASIKYPIFDARLKMTYPLDNQDQAVNERNARWKAEQARQDISKFERLVKDDVLSKIENINTSYQFYLKAKEARQEADVYYIRMSANLRRGRFTASVVRDALDMLVMSREGELKSLVYFNISLLQFEVSKNQLFETYKIDVESYIPKE